MSQTEFGGTERFQILRRLGAGGMGVVYEAFDRERGGHVALKTLQSLTATRLYLFKNEFRSLAGVIHPNLVALHELFSEGDQWFFTMEYVEGLPFTTAILRAAAVAGRDTETFEPLRIDTVRLTSWGDGAQPMQALRRPGDCDYLLLRDALRQLIKGVNVLHAQGKVHKDIKPSNVLVTDAGRVAILDFGLVSDTRMPELEAGGTQVIRGTAAYMSPEQSTGQPLTPATDAYSAGVMLYEALTGWLPQRHTTPREPLELVPGIPRDLSDLTMALLRRDPRQRPTDDDILATLGGGRTRTTREALPEAFVGRAEELGQLTRQYERMCRGQPAIVSVTGQSGIGKSALIREFLLQLQPYERAVILTGRCYEQESVPFKAMDSIVDALSRFLNSLPRREAAALLPRDARRLTKLFPVLERVEAMGAAGARGADPLDRQELRRRAFQALRDLLGRLAEQRPLVVAIDDVQWGDTDSAALLAEVLRPPDAPAMLLILSFREEQPNQGLDLLLSELARMNMGTERIQLTPFTEAEARLLAGQLLGGAAAGDAAGAIAKESRGNALFVRELARQVRVGVSAETGLRLDEVIWQRISDLPDDARRLLEIVAIGGQPVTQRDAYQAAGFADRSPAALLALRAGRLVRSSGEGAGDHLETYHDRVRESVVAHLAEDAARGYHLRLAATLDENRSADAETLAVHFHAGGDAARAGTYYLAGAKKASEALAFRRAAGLFEKALELLDVAPEQRGELLEELADAQANAGLNAEAARHYLEAAATPGREHRLDLERKAGYQFCISGYIDEGVKAFESVLDRVGLKMPTTPLRGVMLAAMQLVRMRLRGTGFRERPANKISPALLDRIDAARAVSSGLSVQDPQRGLHFAGKNTLLALEAGEPDRALRAMSWQAVVIGSLGPRFRKWSEAFLAAAGEICTRRNHALNRGLLAMGHGCADFTTGHYMESRRWLDEAETALGETTGVTWERATVRTYYAWTLICLGNFAELAALAPAYYKDARERGDLYTAVNIGEFPYAAVLLVQDQPTAAAELVDECERLWKPEGYRLQTLMAGIGRTWVEIYRGDYAKACRLMNYHWPRMKSHFFHALENIAVYMADARARAALGMAESLQASGKDARSYLSLARRSAAFMERKSLMHGPGIARVIQAGIAAFSGDRGRTAGLLEDAVKRFDAVSMLMLAHTARRRLGQLRGDGEMVAQAESFMRDQGVADVEKMTRFHVAGISGP